MARGWSELDNTFPWRHQIVRYFWQSVRSLVTIKYLNNYCGKKEVVDRMLAHSFTMNLFRIIAMPGCQICQLDRWPLRHYSVPSTPPSFCSWVSHQSSQLASRWLIGGLSSLAGGKQWFRKVSIWMDMSTGTMLWSTTKIFSYLWCRIMSDEWSILKGQTSSKLSPAWSLANEGSRLIFMMNVAFMQMTKQTLHGALIVMDWNPRPILTQALSKWACAVQKGTWVIDSCLWFCHIRGWTVDITWGWWRNNWGCMKDNLSRCQWRCLVDTWTPSGPGEICNSDSRKG